MQRPLLLSVAEAAAELNASEAYVRRLLVEERLYGFKVGPVWAILPEDLQAFVRTRRPPGRPSTRSERAQASASKARIVTERRKAGTGPMLRKRRR